MAICVAEHTIKCDESLVQASCDDVNCNQGSTCKVTPYSCSGCSSSLCVVDGCFTPIKSYFEDCPTSKTSPHVSVAPTAAYSPAPSDYSTKDVDENADAQYVTSSGQNGQMLKSLALMVVGVVIVVG
jgi:hypothetical protein